MSLLANRVNKLQDAPFPDFVTRPAIALLPARRRQAGEGWSVFEPGLEW